jgi:hypothetical protein
MLVPHKRILLIAIAIGFVSGFAAVTAANGNPAPSADYSAAG